MLGNLHRRIGDEREPRASLTPVRALSAERRAWARAVYSDLDIRQDGTVSPSTQGPCERPAGRHRLYVSPAATGAPASTSATWTAAPTSAAMRQRRLSAASAAPTCASRYLGGYATWSDATGLYVDAVLQGGSHRYTVRPTAIRAPRARPAASRPRSKSARPSRSAAAGRIEPQAQLSYQHSSFDDCAISGARVQQDADGGWIGRLGVRVKGDIATARRAAAALWPRRRGSRQRRQRCRALRTARRPSRASRSAGSYTSVRSGRRRDAGADARP